MKLLSKSLTARLRSIHSPLVWWYALSSFSFFCFSVRGGGVTICLNRGDPPKSRPRFYPRYIPDESGQARLRQAESRSRLVGIHGSVSVGTTQRNRDRRDVPLIRGTWEPVHWITPIRRKTNPLNPPCQGDLKGTRRGKPLAPEGWHVCKNLVGKA